MVFLWHDKIKKAVLGMILAFSTAYIAE